MDWEQEPPLNSVPFFDIWIDTLIDIMHALDMGDFFKLIYDARKASKKHSGPGASFERASQEERDLVNAILLSITVTKDHGRIPRSMEQAAQFKGAFHFVAPPCSVFRLQ